MKTEAQHLAIQESNRTRNRKCGRCGSIYTEIVDGSTIGGLPGLLYLYCAGCGWSTTAHRKRRTAKLK